VDEKIQQSGRQPAALTVAQVNEAIKTIGFPDLSDEILHRVQRALHHPELFLIWFRTSKVRSRTCGAEGSKRCGIGFRRCR
jgi:hypothetical protein